MRIKKSRYQLDFFGRIITYKRPNIHSRFKYYKLNGPAFHLVRNHTHPNVRYRLRSSGCIGLRYVDLSWMVRNRNGLVHTSFISYDQYKKNFGTPRFYRI